MSAHHTDRQQRRQTAQALREEGHSLAAIAQTLGVSRSTITSDLRMIEAERGREARRQWGQAKKEAAATYSEVVSLALTEIRQRLETDPGSLDVDELRQLARDGTHAAQLLTGEATERHGIPTEQLDAEIEQLLSQLRDSG